MVTLNSTRAHNEWVCIPAIDTAQMFAAILLKCLFVAPRGTGWIV
jgi:hypothetical protein